MSRSKSSFPKGPLCTIDTLQTELRELGLKERDTILLHSSLSQLGWVNGGAEAVVRAILTVIGPKGTLVVPTQTGQLSPPIEWSDPPVHPSWLVPIQDTMLAYNAQTSASRGMGQIAETVRTWPGASRSSHPQTSFAAIGPMADVVLKNHPLDNLLGEGSPLGTLEKLGARVLLLGVGFDKCSAFHLAEYRVPKAPLVKQSFRVEVDGKAVWETVDTVDLDSDDFGALGEAFVEECKVLDGNVGAADCKLFALKDAARYAKKWFVKNRGK